MDHPNPYLAKGYAPVRVERDIASLEIEGALPPDLEGVFYRVGPNPQFEPRGAYNPLMGDGMVHAFAIRNGRVSYRNRWVRTQQWRLENEAQRALFASSGNPQEHDPSIANMRSDGVANTALTWHAGVLLAAEEGNVPHALDPETLATRGQWTFAGKLPRNMTAHPKIDPQTGELWMIANFENPRAGRVIAIHVANAAGKIIRSSHIEAPFAPLVHDCALSERYFIVPISPVTVSMKRAMEGKPLLAWEPELGTHLAVVSRDTGEVRWFEGEPGMAWHVVNAFDDGGRITLDVCRQAEPAFPFVDGSPTSPPLLTQQLTRWTMEWDGPARFASLLLSEERCEYPRIDERHTASQYCHAFVACHGGPGSGDIFQRGVGHFDHIGGTMRTYHAGDSFAVAEPVFAPRRGGAEGQGYLLTNIYDEARDASFLAVFDTEDITLGPIARVHVGHRVPVGFHGLWKPD